MPAAWRSGDAVQVASSGISNRVARRGRRSFVYMYWLTRLRRDGCVDFAAGCPVRIRTSIDGVRVRSLTVRRRGNPSDRERTGQTGWTHDARRRGGALISRGWHVKHLRRCPWHCARADHDPARPCPRAGSGLALCHIYGPVPVTEIRKIRYGGFHSAGQACCGQGEGRHVRRGRFGSHGEPGAGKVRW